MLNHLLKSHFSKHYAVLYCQLNTPQPCASCDVLPKQGTCFTRHSPDVIVINDLLSELNCDDNTVHLKESDCVCNACYRAHLATTEKDMCKSNNDTQLMQIHGNGPSRYESYVACSATGICG